MAVMRVRYVRRKGPGWYFQPTPTMREAGFHPEALGVDQVAAFARAGALLAEWDAFRRGAEESTPPAKRGSIAWLVELYQKSPEYENYRPKTQAEFDRLADTLCGEWGAFAAAAIERKHVKGFYREQREKLGLDHANRLVKTLRLLLGLAVDEGLVDANHATRMRLEAPAPRAQLWRADEVDAFCAAASVAGRDSIALAVKLAFDLGQRQADVLAMTWSQYDGAGVTLTQRKTGRTIRVPCLPSLRALLDKTKRRAVQIVVSEKTGRPYQQFNFVHLFREIADAAGFGEKQFLDLRRSAAVRLAEAGCTTEEIVAITGHQIARGAQILEVYVPRSSAMAKSAIAKLTRRTKKERKVGKSN